VKGGKSTGRKDTGRKDVRVRFLGPLKVLGGEVGEGNDMHGLTQRFFEFGILCKNGR